MCGRSRKNSWESYFQSGLLHKLEQVERECLGWLGSCDTVYIPFPIFPVFTGALYVTNPYFPVFTRSHFAALTICVAVADSSVSIPFSGCPKTSSAPLLLLPPHVSLFSLPLKLLPPFPTSLSRHCSGWISCPSVGADSIPLPHPVVRIVLPHWPTHCPLAGNLQKTSPLSGLHSLGSHQTAHHWPLAYNLQIKLFFDLHSWSPWFLGQADLIVTLCPVWQYFV